jgi:uncharacterized protein YdbL (DUF1318 family)
MLASHQLVVIIPARAVAVAHAHTMEHHAHHITGMVVGHQMSGVLGILDNGLDGQTARLITENHEQGIGHGVVVWCLVHQG